MIKDFKKNGLWWTLVNLVLAGLAVALGADGAFAMSESVVVTTDESIADRKVPDSKGDETQLPGTSATRGAQVESGFAEDEIDEAIAYFHAYKNPTGLFIHELCQKKNVEEYEQVHYRVADPVYQIPVLAQATSEDGDETTIKLSYTGAGKHIDPKLARYLYPWKCIYVLGANGWKKIGSDWVIDGMLALQVKQQDKSNSKVVLEVLNPKVGTATVIPADSTLIIGAVAGAESQMQVSPDNFEPVPSKVYLQKRIFNVAFTKEFIAATNRNKVVFGEADIRRGALSVFKMANEITDLLGVATKRKVEVSDNLAPEFVYTTEGVMRQINMLYTYDHTQGVQPTDLTAISQMMFTKFSEHAEAYALCGQDFIASLLNMSYTTNKDIRFEDVELGGLTLRGWKNNFGTISFAYLPLMDMLKWSKCAVLIDWKNAVCYMKRAGKTSRVDMEKGTGDTREAVRDCYSQIYGIGLKGYNSMIVCPDDEAPTLGLTLPNLRNVATVYTTSTLPDSESSPAPVAGDRLYLTVAAGGFPAGSVVEYDGTNWGYASGVIMTV